MMGVPCPAGAQRLWIPKNPVPSQYRSDDADEPEPEVHQLMFALKGATMLPFVILSDAEENYLDGSRRGPTGTAQDDARVRAGVDVPGGTQVGRLSMACWGESKGRNVC